MKQVFALLMLFLLPSLGMAIVISGSNVQFGEIPGDPNLPPLYGLGVFQTPTGDDGTGINFGANYDSLEGRLTITCTDYVIDQGVDAWLVSWGTPFTRERISMGAFEPLHVLDDKYSFTLTQVWEPTTFYLGLNTGAGLASRSVFGWVALEYRPQDDSLRMVDNAMAYDAAGIVVGTYTPIVPEPGSAIFGVAALLAALNARRAAGGKRGEPVFLWPRCCGQE